MYVIVGASSGVGRAIAEVFAAKGCDLLLVSREVRDISAVASDLMLRFGVSAKAVALDLGAPQPDFSEILDDVRNCGERFEGLLLPAGTSSDTDTLDIDTSAIEGLLRVNYMSLCVLINEILRVLRIATIVTIVGFGSVASIRGRGTNMIYSSAKMAMRFYFESLRHACVGKKVIAQFYVLGYMDTNLAFAHNLSLPKGAPGELAQRVYRDIRKDIGVRYFPRYWLIIAMIVRLIPWSVYKHLKF